MSYLARQGQAGPSFLDPLIFHQPNSGSANLRLPQRRAVELSFKVPIYLGHKLVAFTSRLLVLLFARIPTKQLPSTRIISQFCGTKYLEMGACPSSCCPGRHNSLCRMERYLNLIRCEGKSRDGLYEPVLAESEREAVADLLQYLENVWIFLSNLMYTGSLSL